jgi:Zn-dependent M28 family amino/carboxypeptidase
MNLKECLLNHLQELVRERDPYFTKIGHLYVQEYIREQLGKLGNVETFNFNFRGGTHYNFILNLPDINGGTVNTNTPILIGAHYDTVPGTMGADDNATGVAVLLEIAQAIAKKPARYPVQLVAFDLEEYGLVGSTEYAHYLEEKQQKIRLMVSLEMLGYCDQSPGSQDYPPCLKYIYPNRGNYIALVGNFRIIPDLIKLSNKIKSNGTPCQWLPVINQGMDIPATRLSDHAPFWDCNYPALMVTDTAFMRNPHYHQYSDRIDTLDLDFLTGVCQGLIAGIYAL